MEGGGGAMHIPGCLTAETELLDFDRALEEALAPSPDYDAERWLYVLLPALKVGSNICHVLRLPPFSAASKTAQIKYIISEL